MDYIYRTGIGQDHHRIEPVAELNSIYLGGVEIPCRFKVIANSDGDVVLHAIVNAISGLGCEPVLGAKADELCACGIINSQAYLTYALELLSSVHKDIVITHVSLSIEALRPKLLSFIPSIRANIANLLDLNLTDVGVTATTGEGLTGMGEGKGIAVLCIITAKDRI